MGIYLNTGRSSKMTGFPCGLPLTKESPARTRYNKIHDGHVVCILINKQKRQVGDTRETYENHVEKPPPSLAEKGRGNQSPSIRTVVVRWFVLTQKEEDPLEGLGSLTGKPAKRGTDDGWMFRWLDGWVGSVSFSVSRTCQISPWIHCTM